MLLQTQERDVVWNKINDFTMYNYEKKTEKKDFANLSCI